MKVDTLRTGALPTRLCVLGVDPAASGPTGYGVVQAEGRALRSLHCDARLPDRRATFPERLREIYQRVVELVAEFSPDALAVEDVFTAPNVRSSLKLAEVRGVVLLAAAQGGLPVHSYSPRQVKAGVTGYGAATKEQIQRTVSALLRLRRPPESPDAADALAVALCHIFAAQARARFAPAAGSSAWASRPRTAARIESLG